VEGCIAELRDKIGLGDIFGLYVLIFAWTDLDLGSDEAVAGRIWRIGVKAAVIGQHVPFHPGTRGFGLVRDLVLQFAGLHAESAATHL
jgi:hypothetical protein